MRIVSLVPSITELLFTLGLGEEVIGITKFCVHPDEWFRTRQRVGGTKNINLELITVLGPDLIIANKEENVKEQIDALSSRFTVLLTDVDNFEEALLMIEDVGNATGKSANAKNLINTITDGFSTLKDTGLKPAAYFIWKDPWMTVGGDTYINSMMRKAGFQNIYENEKRYPEVNLADLKEKAPEYILLSSEPYPFREKHIGELSSIFPDSTILLVDGEIFSWYGSRMLEAPEYFRNIRP